MSHKLTVLVPQEIEINVDSPDFWKDLSYELDVFDAHTLDFFEALSRSILKDKEVNRRPEMVALAFWLRRANLEKLKSEHSYWFNQESVIYQPVGRVLHVCPANVDTMFVYSWALSMLCGNKNILRISKRIQSFQISFLLHKINETLSEEQFSVFRDYIAVISYNHNDEISNYICERVQARVIWGGDQTVKTFKKFNTSPRTRDICFADRISFSLLDAAVMVNADEKEFNGFIQRFYNDSYTFDQLGCSSPQTICFIGNESDCKAALDKFSNEFVRFAKERYETDMASLAGLKLNKLSSDAIDGIIDNKATENNLLVLAHAKEPVFQEKSCGAGYFYYQFSNELSSVLKYITTKNQTITHYGLKREQLRELVTLTKGKGIDRIVPVGTGLDFHYIWDGYRLTEELTSKKFLG